MLALAGADFPTEFLQCTKNLGKLRLWKLICTSALVSSTLLLRWIRPEVYASGFFLRSYFGLDQNQAILAGFPLTVSFIQGSAMKTFSAKAHEVQRDWFVVDGSGKVLGRLAAEIALRLRGKHKPEFTPHVDTGDFIVVVNAAQIRVTGDKAEGKRYFRHSGFPGGITETTFRNMQSRFPGRALEKAVKGMLPKGPLGYAMLKKLKVYAEGSHPHAAQQPKVLEI